MPRPGEELAAETARPSDLVTAPILKFAIGTVASLCAVLVPRLLAGLATRDQANITFITREYGELAVLLSALVGVVVAILEWRVPRAPRDTFMTTLGIPAILAGALSANQNAGALQSATQTQEVLADKLGQASGIAIESPTTTVPLAMPMRQPSSTLPAVCSAGMVAAMSSAARTARSASSSCACG